jgi:transcriptional regulator with XRE-family HTH domain
LRVEINSLRGFESFSEWLRYKTKKPGGQAELARACDVPRQTITRWLNGGKPKPDKLQAIAAWAGVDYVSLRLLLDGQSPLKPDDKTRFQCRTELGAHVGRRFEELQQVNNSAALQILGAIDAALATQPTEPRALPVDLPVYTKPGAIKKN